MNFLDHLRKRSYPAYNTHRKSLQSSHLPLLHSHTAKHQNHRHSTPIKHSVSPKSFSKYARWDSLPPINELKRSKILDLQPRKSQVIEQLLLSKHEASKSSHSHRNKTQMSAYRKKYLLSQRSSNLLNFEQHRMKPVDKYYKKLDNIRMAQRLLTIKPSPGLNRGTLKKFYLQQRNYRSQISKNADYVKLKSHKSKRSSKLVKEWFF